MEPSKKEVEYAEEQISEAKRRLDGIFDRVGIEVTKDESQTTNQEDLSDYDESISEFVSYLNVKETEKRVSPELIESHIQNVVIDCQLCIELSVKSMFKLSGMDHPFSHGISFENGMTQGFYSKIPEDFERKDDIVRVIFLTQFWKEFYELAKYGAPQLNVRPEMIFDIDDASRAVKDSEYCLEVAVDLLDYIKSNQ